MTFWSRRTYHRHDTQSPHGFPYQESFIFLATEGESARKCKATYQVQTVHPCAYIFRTLESLGLTVEESFVFPGRMYEYCRCHYCRSPTQHKHNDKEDAWYIACKSMGGKCLAFRGAAIYVAVAPPQGNRGHGGQECRMEIRALQL